MPFLKTKLVLRFALAMAGLVTTVTAHADTMYSFTLTPDVSSIGKVGGTGTVTFATPIPATGSFDAKQGGAITATTTNLLALTLTMSNGTMFNLASENTGALADITFFNRTLSNFSFSANSKNPQVGVGGNHYDFSTNGNFNGAAYSSGTVTFNVVPLAAAPEPSGLILMSTGLLGAAVVARRKFLAHS